MIYLLGVKSAYMYKPLPDNMVELTSFEIIPSRPENRFDREEALEDIFEELNHKVNRPQYGNLFYRCLSAIAGHLVHHIGFLAKCDQEVIIKNLLTDLDYLERD